MFQLILKVNGANNNTKIAQTYIDIIGQYMTYNVNIDIIRTFLHCNT